VNAVPEVTDFTITSAVQVSGSDTLVEYGSELVFTFKLSTGVTVVPAVTANGVPTTYSYDAAAGAYVVRVASITEAMTVAIAIGVARTVTVNSYAAIEVLSASAPEMENLVQKYVLAQGSAFTFTFRVREDGYEAPEVTTGNVPYTLAPPVSGVYTVTLGSVLLDTTVSITIELRRLALSISSGDHVALQTPENDTIWWGNDYKIRFTLDEGYDPTVTAGGTALPTFAPDADGLYLGGGYPELHGARLAANVSMREDIRRHVKAGLPTFAECGGFIVLCDSLRTDEDVFAMCGALKGDVAMTRRLTRFGYVHLTAKRQSVLAPQGWTGRGHEFHYSDGTDNGDGFLIYKPDGRAWEGVHVSPSLHAGYPHLHLCGDPQLAVNFARACVEYREKKK
jgi:hypothetical protein